MDAIATQNDDEEAVLVPRDKTRASIFLGAVVQLGDETQSRNVRVRNISSGGMMIDLDGPQPTGLRVVSEMKGVGVVHGQIVWSTENRAGVMFDKQIDPALARHTPNAAPVAPIYAQALIDNSRDSELRRRPGLGFR